MRKNKLLLIASREQLIQDLAELKNPCKVAEKYSINPITVYSAYDILGINCRRKTYAEIENVLTREALEQDYTELQSFRKMGKKHGVSKEAIEFHMKKYGLEYNELKRYTADHNFFSRINEETFYVAGFIAADGCVKVRSKSYSVYIGLSRKDKSFLEMIKNVLKAESVIHDTINKLSKYNPKWKDTLACEISITSKQMFDDLAKFNVVPRKTKIYTFPEWLINHPLCHHFMRGYNDGDGSFYVPKPKPNKLEQAYFSLRGTPEFLRIYRNILEENCNMKKRIKDIRISWRCGILEYGGNGVLGSIADFLYRDATIFLPRKFEVIKHLLTSNH